MRGRYLFGVLGLVLLTACSYKEPGGTAEVEEMQPSVSLESRDGNRELDRDDIGAICDRLYSSVLDCNDGSQIIVSGISDTYIYIRYVPREFANGRYEFFRNVQPSGDVSYRSDGTVDIPVSINGYDDSRFVMNVEYSAGDGGVEISGVEFTFSNQGDADFHEMYAALDSQAQMEYRRSLTPDGEMTDEKLAGFLRACVYNGNYDVLGRLYDLIPEEQVEERYSLELAASRVWDTGISFSELNSFMPDIFYGESCQDFPQMEILDLVAESLQKGRGLEAMETEEMKPNMDWAEVYQIPGLHNLYHLYEDERVTGIYKYDLDRDGLPEILVVLPGGSMGNLFWEILHLNEEGEITGTNSGEGIGWLSLYRYQGNYFFLSDMIDFNDKEQLGYKVHMMNQRDQMLVADIYREKCGTEIVFTDKYAETDSGYYLDWELERYIDKYKAYMTGDMGNAVGDAEEIQRLFQGADIPGGFYGTMDFNNDNVEDWINVYQFFTSTRYPYYCSYVFVDGKTKQVLDFSRLTDLSYNLRGIYRYESDNKNYFICLLGGNGNYVLKLIEFRGVEPVEMQDWYVAVKNQILIKVYENQGARIGI